ncbi:MAG: hypothetical protein QMC17_02095 [Paracoccaceae bacterium]
MFILHYLPDTAATMFNEATRLRLCNDRSLTEEQAATKPASLSPDHPSGLCRYVGILVRWMQ